MLAGGRAMIRSPSEARRQTMIEGYKKRLRENLGIDSKSSEATRQAGESDESARLEEERRQQSQQLSQQRGRSRTARQHFSRWRRPSQQEERRLVVSNARSAGSSLGSSASATSVRTNKLQF